MSKKLNPESFQTCLDLDNWGSGGSNWVAFKMPPMFFGFYWFWPTELGFGLDYGKFPIFYPPFFVQASFPATPSGRFPRQNHHPGEEELRLPFALWGRDC